MCDALSFTCMQMRLWKIVVDCVVSDSWLFHSAVHLLWHVRSQRLSPALDIGHRDR